MHVRNLIIIFLIFLIPTSFALANCRDSSERIPKLLEQGRLEYQLKNYDWAIKYYNQAFKLDATNPRIHFGMASAYLALNNYELAIEHFHIALEHNPALIESYYGISAAHFALGQNKKGIKNYRKALGLEGLETNHSISSFNKVTLSSSTDT